MEKMRDILNVLTKVAKGENGMEEIKREIENAFGWEVELILVQRLSGLQEGTTSLKILFTPSFLIEARVYENEHLRRIGEDCDYTLKKMINDVKSKIRLKYDVGYTRTWIEYQEDAMIRMILERMYKPLLIKAYKPVLKYLKGFYRRDYFGIQADISSFYIYYSLVRSDREEAKTLLGDVVTRLEKIEREIKGDNVLTGLREADEKFESKIKQVCRSFDLASMAVDVDTC
jgi:hypothetical protein